MKKTPFNTWRIPCLISGLAWILYQKLTIMKEWFLVNSLPFITWKCPHQRKNLYHFSFWIRGPTFYSLTLLNYFTLIVIQKRQTISGIALSSTLFKNLLIDTEGFIVTMTSARTHRDIIGFSWSIGFPCMLKYRLQCLCEPEPSYLHQLRQNNLKIEGWKKLY